MFVQTRTVQSKVVFDFTDKQGIDHGGVRMLEIDRTLNFKSTDEKQNTKLQWEQVNNTISQSNGHLALQYLSATPSSTVYVDEDATKWLNQLTTAETGPGSDLK